MVEKRFSKASEVAEGTLKLICPIFLKYVFCYQIIQCAIKKIAPRIEFVLGRPGRFHHNPTHSNEV